MHVLECSRQVGDEAIVIVTHEDEKLLNLLIKRARAESVDVEVLLLINFFTVMAEMSETCDDPGDVVGTNLGRLQRCEDLHGI